MLRYAVAALAATFAISPAAAQEAEQPGTLSSQGAGPGLVFTLSGGLKAEPSFFGSDDIEVGPDLGVELNAARIGGLTFGNPDPNYIEQGLNFGGSFRFIDERSASDDAFLTGLEDVDASLELGGEISYGTRDFRAFGAVRYGVIGHESFVGEIGADVFSRPNSQLTLHAGPRLLFGSDDYTSTYFGVTAAESAASAFPVYSPDGGLVSAGVEVGLDYRLNENWGIDATVRADRLTGDAADSPIVQDESQITATIGLTRRFTFGF